MFSRVESLQSNGRAFCAENPWICDPYCHEQLEPSSNCKYVDKSVATCFGEPVSHKFVYDPAKNFHVEMSDFGLLYKFPRCWKAIAPLICKKMFRPCRVTTFGAIDDNGTEYTETSEYRMLLSRSECLKARSECQDAVDFQLWPVFLECSGSDFASKCKRRTIDVDVPETTTKNCFTGLVESQLNGTLNIFDQCAIPCRKFNLFDLRFRNIVILIYALFHLFMLGVSIFLMSKILGREEVDQPQKAIFCCFAAMAYSMICALGAMSSSYDCFKGIRLNAETGASSRWETNAVLNAVFIAFHSQTLNYSIKVLYKHHNYNIRNIHLSSVSDFVFGLASLVSVWLPLFTHNFKPEVHTFFGNFVMVTPSITRLLLGYFVLAWACAVSGTSYLALLPKTGFRKESKLILPGRRYIRVALILSFLVLAIQLMSFLLLSPLQLETELHKKAVRTALDGGDFEKNEQEKYADLSSLGILVIDALIYVPFAFLIPHILAEAAKKPESKNMATLGTLQQEMELLNNDFKKKEHAPLKSDSKLFGFQNDDVDHEEDPLMEFLIDAKSASDNKRRLPCPSMLFNWEKMVKKISA
ncbi:unnamed protein product [Caenorhabditis auriculariae]|uniref:FZ domain-containing protein n=1 Tax=Caenorhabditis auriculariae TaxID=2777116 RepID=A0A8S1GPC0_9PELO|nr:unnamed protein product [Caenorhabditis auriculariae]